MKRLIALLLIVFGPSIAIGVLIFISVLPYIHQLGFGMIALLLLCITCAGALVLGFTIRQINLWVAEVRKADLNSRLAIGGETMAYRYPNGKFEHLSAEHVRAGVPLLSPAVNEVEVNEIDESSVVELYQRGSTVESIARAYGVTPREIAPLIPRDMKEEEPPPKRKPGRPKKVKANTGWRSDI